VPSKPWLRYQWATPSTAGWRNLWSHLVSEQGAAYYVPNYVMEQHGEWDLCDIRAGETGCFAESLPAGYANLIDFPLDFEGELNDGRRTHAPNLTWWLEIGVGWTSEVAGKKPLSYAVLVEDHFGMVNGHQHTYENCAPREWPAGRRHQNSQAVLSPTPASRRHRAATPTSVGWVGGS